MKKEDEIAATNKLLQLIRGEKGRPEDEESKNYPAAADKADSVEEFSRIDSSIAHSSVPEEDKEPRSPGDSSDLFEDTDLTVSRIVSSVMSDGKSNIKKESDQPVYRQQGEIAGNIKSCLGLDIGSRYIKFVQLQRRINKYHLISWGIINTFHNASGDGPVMTDALKNLFKSVSPSHTRVISSVGGSSVIVRHIKFPPLSDKEIAESIRWEAKSYIPFPLRDVNIDYQILNRSAKNKQTDVLLVAAAKKLLQAHLDSLQNIRIKPSIVDINSLALVNAFSFNAQAKDDRAIVLLDIGFSTTILNIYKKDDLYLTRDIPIAGDAFTLFIQKEKQLNYEEAENLKQDKNFDINTIRTVLDSLTKEIRRSLIYYDNQTSRRGFSRIILTGGSSRLCGLIGYFSEELGLSVEISNPLQAIQIDSKKFSQEELQFFSPQMALSVGLANRYR